MRKQLVEIELNINPVCWPKDIPDSLLREFLQDVKNECCCFQENMERLRQKYDLKAKQYVPDNVIPLYQ